MKAIGNHTAGPVSLEQSLVAFEAAMPTPGPQDLLVRVRAVSVNPVDTKIRSSSGAVDGLPRILGWDAAGEVTAVGDQVKGFAIGDAVFYAGDLTRPGSNAEFQCVDSRLAAHKPRRLDFAAAAALPLTSITAWEMLFDRLKVSAGAPGTLLIVGGAGGVGSMLIQLARRFTALQVVATASRPESAAWCRQLGAHLVIDPHRPWAAQLADAGLNGVSHVASLTASDQHWSQIVEVTLPQGQIALIDDPKSLDVMPLKRKSLSLHWEFMFTRSMFATADIAAQGALLSKVAQAVDDGTLQGTLQQHAGSLSVENLRRVHAALESGSSIGKWVLDGF